MENDLPLIIRNGILITLQDIKEGEELTVDVIPSIKYEKVQHLYCNALLRLGEDQHHAVDLSTNSTVGKRRYRSWDQHDEIPFDSSSQKLSYRGILNDRVFAFTFHRCRRGVCTGSSASHDDG